MPPLRRVTLAAGGALEAERRVRDLPAVADRPDPHVVADAHVGEEDLVERRRPAHLPDRPDLDAGRVHRDQEHRQAGLLGDVRIGPGEQQAVVGEPGAGRPHLLAVDAAIRRPPGTAVVATAARSEPAPGSLNSWQHSRSERRNARAYFSRCASVPKVAIVGPTRPGRDADQLGRRWRLEAPAPRR